MREQPQEKPSYEDLVAANGALVARIAELEAVVEQLTAKANTTSWNSSKPPSSDAPWKKGHQKAKSGERRKRGGQPGHTKADRKLEPPEKMDSVTDVFPTNCGGCGKQLKGLDPDALRHQVVDIPPLALDWSEWSLHALTCDCGEVTRAKLPEGVPRGAFGPNIEALIVLLTGHHRMSRRSTQEFLKDVLGLDISLGAISKIEGRVSEILAPTHVEALDRVRDAQAKHADETSWRQEGQKFWMWVAKSDEAAAFLIRDSRSSKVARELLGEEPSGTIVTDRFSSYSWMNIEQRQVCWAHLLRDFQKIEDSGGEDAKRIGEELGLFGGAMFVWLYKYRDGEIPKSKWIARAADFRRSIKKLLEEGAGLDHWRMPGICESILKVESALWTFVDTEGVEPTNNDAERAIRRAVIWRKTSLGTQSERGSRYVERMLTCAATLRIQGKSVFRFLRHSCGAALRGEPPSSLFA